MPAATTTNATPRRAELSARRAELVRLLDEAYVGPAWHGPSLRGSLRGLSAVDALRRPAPGRNHAWDLVLHAAYGKHLVMRRVDPTIEETFPRKLAKSWWPRFDEDAEPHDEAAWRRDRDLLEECHRRLVDAVRAAPDSRFAERRPRVRHTIGDEVAGIALHDVYHAGQLRLIRRLTGSV